MSDNGVRLPEGGESEPAYLAVKYSCPEWIISLWINAYGLDNAIALAEKALEPAPIVIRTNTTKITPDELYGETGNQIMNIKRKFCNLRILKNIFKRMKNRCNKYYDNNRNE